MIKKSKVIFSLIMGILFPILNVFTTAIMGMATKDLYDVILKNPTMGQIPSVITSFWIGLGGTILCGVLVVISFIYGTIATLRIRDAYDGEQLDNLLKKLKEK